MMWLKLIVCIVGLTFGKSEIVKRACEDTIPNCSQYTTSICSNPLYTNWVITKCAKFCNKCDGAPTIVPQTTDDTCRDTIVYCYEFTKDVCTNRDYDEWVLKNCALYCHRCGPSAITTTPKPATVSSLGTCHDALPNCQNYGSGVCTEPSYSAWVLENCAQTCNKCGGNGPTNAACEDNVSNCAALQQKVNICNDPTARIYVDQNCRLTCGLCTGGSRIPDNCVDLLTNCKDYDAAICTGTTYLPWVKHNCAKTCNKCDVTTTPSAIVGTSLGCVYVGQTYQEGATWKDGCKYLCTCENGLTGKYVCNQMCLTWDLPTHCHMTPAAAGKCCATPSCPAGITINYPPGYVEH